jgi:hypothetical protein
MHPACEDSPRFENPKSGPRRPPPTTRDAKQLCIRNVKTPLVSEINHDPEDPPSSFYRGCETVTHPDREDPPRVEIPDLGKGENIAQLTMVKSCEVCGSAMDVKACGGRCGAWYCGTQCQKQHWPTHKLTCQPAAPRPRIVIPSPHPTLEGSPLWKHMLEATAAYFHEKGNKWPESKSLQKMHLEASTFAEHLIHGDCHPVVRLCVSGVVITGERWNPELQVKVVEGDADQTRFAVLIRTEPCLGEIWVRTGDELQYLACTNSFVRSWVRGPRFPKPAESRIILVLETTEWWESKFMYTGAQVHHNTP